MAPQNLKATIVHKEQVAEKTFLLRMSLENAQPIDFQAGQFATLLVAPNIRRSYSIASAPGLAHIDFIADAYAGGPGSQFFLNSKVGDRVEMLAPLGRFVYQENPRDAIFLATGSGIVPFFAMIDHALQNIKTTRLLHLYSGYRYVPSIFGADKFNQYKINYPNFLYTLSISQPDENWQGFKGRITEYYEMDIQNPDIDAYICGSKEMIMDTKQRLLSKGVPESQIFFEQFY